MIAQAPAWEHRSDRSLVQGYGYVQLIGPHVLGQWFCLERSSGRLLWQGDGHGMTDVSGHAHGIVVGTEMVSSGPGTYSRGCKAMRIATGALAWEATPPAPRGLFERFWRSFIIVTEAVSFVDGDEVFLDSGRVLDLRSGTELRRIDKAKLGALSGAHWKARMDDDAHRFYVGEPVAFAGGLLKRGTPGEATPNTLDRTTPLAFYFERADGSIAWRHALDAGLQIDGNFHSYRWVPPSVLVIAAPRGDAAERAYRLIEVDARDGSTRAEFALDEAPNADCRIEDADANDLLVSGRRADGTRWLRCYRHRAGAAA